MNIFDKMESLVVTVAEKAEQAKQQAAYAAKLLTERDKLPYGEVGVFSTILDAFHDKGVINSEDRDRYRELASLAKNKRFTADCRVFVHDFLSDINSRPENCVRELVNEYQYPENTSVVIRKCLVDILEKQFADKFICVKGKYRSYYFVLDAENTLRKAAGALKYANAQIDKEVKAKQKEANEYIELLDRIEKAKNVRCELRNFESSRLQMQVDNNLAAEYALKCADPSFAEKVFNFLEAAKYAWYDIRRN